MFVCRLFLAHYYILQLFLLLSHFLTFRVFLACLFSSSSFLSVDSERIGFAPHKEHYGTSRQRGGLTKQGPCSQKHGILTSTHSKSVFAVP